MLGLRPETVDLSTKDVEGALKAHIYACQPAGSETLVNLTVGKTEFLAIRLGIEEFEMNQEVSVILHPDRMNVYNKQTTRLIKFARSAHKADEEA